MTPEKNVTGMSFVVDAEVNSLIEWFRDQWMAAGSSTWPGTVAMSLKQDLREKPEPIRLYYMTPDVLDNSPGKELVLIQLADGTCQIAVYESVHWGMKRGGPGALKLQKGESVLARLKLAPLEDGRVQVIVDFARDEFVVPIASLAAGNVEVPSRSPAQQPDTHPLGIFRIPISTRPEERACQVQDERGLNDDTRMKLKDLMEVRESNRGQSRVEIQYTDAIQQVGIDTKTVRKHAYPLRERWYDHKVPSHELVDPSLL